MQLYVDSNYFSPYAMSVFVALKEKGQAFELIPVDLSAAENKSTVYVAKSLTQRVPTLVTGEFSLSESSAIAEFLDETLPGRGLYPDDLQARARARQVQAWLRSDLLALRVARPTEVIFQRKRCAPLSVEAQQAAEKFLAAAGVLLSPGQEHLFGDWCIADTDMAVMLNRLVIHGDPVPKHLADYATCQFERGSVREWLALPRP